MVGFNASKRENATQLVPHRAFLGSRPSGEVSSVVYSAAPAIVVQELRLALEHHARVRRQLSLPVFVEVETLSLQLTSRLELVPIIAPRHIDRVVPSRSLLQPLNLPFFGPAHLTVVKRFRQRTARSMLQWFVTLFPFLSHGSLHVLGLHGLLKVVVVLRGCLVEHFRRQTLMASVLSALL